MIAAVVVAGWVGLLGGCGTFIRGPLPTSWDAVVVDTVDAIEGAQILDARTAEDYAAGHIPGAAQVHWTELTGMDAEGLWGPLPPETLTELLSARGLSADVPLLIYGSGPEGYGDDGDVYWTLRYLGHPEVYLLNGGWVGWLASGSGEPSTSRTDAPAPRDDFAVALAPEILASTAEVADWDGVILDVRSAEEWQAGHIPGAVWMEWTAVFGDGGALDAPEALWERFAALGISPEVPVVVYCAGGIRAGHTYMVLDALGHPAVKNYVGSWQRWTAEGGEVIIPSGR